ncbi:hypothetical protein [Sanguibacter suaedae]|uniref:PH domain-containing protein n=1 Tax=Sanguibacter suaedae TaxID=2795737 RepID=A0A934IC79_9MICO|nr:hypothetical protein [Sanguibacter suaedae]MBI9115110.1 hypothetical protein [Sanguibacter suaedae]
MNPQSTDPGTDRFVAGKAAPLVAALALAGVLLLVTWWLVTSGRNGSFEAAPEDVATMRTIVYAIAGVAALGALWMLLRIPTILRHRLEIGPDGIHHGGGAHALHLEWSQIRSARVLVLTTTKPVATSPMPRQARTSARIELQLELHDPAALEERHPSLRRRRVPTLETDGYTQYTHRIDLGPGALFPSSDPADFARPVQEVLSRVAGPVYRGASIRRTATTWSRG